MNRIPSRQTALHLMIAVALGIAAVAPVQAQIQQRPIDARARGEERIDPPARVGRLADVTGQVWLWSPDSGEWIGAQRNRPLTTGDRLATDANSRAEVNIGSTTLRLDGGSEVEVLRLDDRQISLRLHSGSAAARLRTRESADEFELVTDEGRFRATRAGRYRIDRTDDTSFVTVENGQGVFEGSGSALTLAPGQRAEFWLGGADRLEYRMVERERDSFASWTYERDQRDDRSASSRYVSPEMTGVEDLDRYGRWEQNPEYGALWIPRGVPTDWAPYSTGHWTWVQPWGWTWVDDAPWGFAPFHYGRWVNVRNVWCWSPGQRVQRPVYAPALVAWVGGSGFSLSVSGGNRAPAVGWFPLAPREVYVPSYRHSPSYVRQVNVTHVTNVTVINEAVNRPRDGRRDYDNRRFPHAVTVVPASIVTSRQPVGPAARQWRDSGRAVEALAPAAAVAAVIAAPTFAAPPQRRDGDPRLIRPPVVGAPAVAAVQPVDRADRRGGGRRGDERGEGRGRDVERRVDRPAQAVPAPAAAQAPAPVAAPVATPTAPLSPVDRANARREAGSPISPVDRMNAERESGGALSPVDRMRAEGNAQPPAAVQPPQAAPARVEAEQRRQERRARQEPQPTAPVQAQPAQQAQAQQAQAQAQAARAQQEQARAQAAQQQQQVQQVQAQQAARAQQEQARAQAAQARAQARAQGQPQVQPAAPQAPAAATPPAAPAPEAGEGRRGRGQGRGGDAAGEDRPAREDRGQGQGQGRGRGRPDN